jgi:hypothetical protein
VTTHTRDPNLKCFSAWINPEQTALYDKTAEQLWNAGVLKDNRGHPSATASRYALVTHGLRLCVLEARNPNYSAFTSPEENEKYDDTPNYLSFVDEGEAEHLSKVADFLFARKIIAQPSSFALITLGLKLAEIKAQEIARKEIEMLKKTNDEMNQNVGPGPGPIPARAEIRDGGPLRSSAPLASAVQAGQSSTENLETREEQPVGGILNAQ